MGLDNIYVSNPLATPAANTVYTVLAKTEYGCWVTDSIRIRVSPTVQIAVPNAFTPGADVNTYFKVIRNGIASLHYFRIWDRWGNKVYESTDIDAGWDGTYKGKPQPFGVYVYEIEAVAVNTGRIVTKRGNVTLLR